MIKGHRRLVLSCCLVLGTIGPGTPFSSTPSGGGVALRRSGPLFSSPATAARDSETETGARPDVIGTVGILVPSDGSAISGFGKKSPADSPTYRDAADQLARKISHFSDGRIVATVVSPGEECLAYDAFFGLGLTSPEDVQFLSRTFRERRDRARDTGSTRMAQFAVDCGDNHYAPLVGLRGSLNAFACMCTFKT